jgi:hypothetical protein
MKRFLFCLLVSVVSLQANAQNKIEVDITTGADNLEPKDFMDNPSLVLRIKDKPEIVMTDINKGQKWNSNSTHRITIPLTADIPLNYISEIELYRKDKDGSKNNFEAIAADNWDIKKIIVTATFKEDGRTVKYKLLHKESSRLLKRFVYEKKSNNVEETDVSVRYVMDQRTIISGAAPHTPSNPNLVIAKPVKLLVEITTGGDDLRGGGDNVSLKIFLKNNLTPIVWRNINASRKLDNNSVKLAEKTFSQILNVDEIEKIEMWHDGGGGMGADNWDVDKVSIIAKIDSQQKILVDKVGNPLHRFTGDTRKKIFVVE